MIKWISSLWHINQNLKVSWNSLASITSYPGWVSNAAGKVLTFSARTGIQVTRKIQRLHHYLDWSFSGLTPHSQVLSKSTTLKHEVSNLQFGQNHGKLTCQSSSSSSSSWQSAEISTTWYNWMPKIKSLDGYCPLQKALLNISDIMLD